MIMQSDDTDRRVGEAIPRSLDEWASAVGETSLPNRGVVFLAFESALDQAHDSDLRVMG